MYSKVVEDDPSGSSDETETWETVWKVENIELTREQQWLHTNCSRILTWFRLQPTGADFECEVHWWLAEQSKDFYAAGKTHKEIG